MPESDTKRRADETLAILRDCHAVLAGDHFVYISGNHGSGWIDKDAIFVDPRRIDRLAKLLADAVCDTGAEMVCGPAIGGAIVAQWTAFALSLPAVFAEHDAAPAGAELRGRFSLRRGYDRRVSGRRVLVVDDVVSTGHSIRETVQAVGRAGGEVAAAAALVHRGNVDASGLGVTDYRYLLEYDIPEWPAAGCPLCKQGVLVNTRYAHGQDFLAGQRGRG